MFRIRGFLRRRRLLKFYRQFVARGDLVFDVGANRGDLSQLFLSLGAKVVAVEPQEDCAALLRSRFSEQEYTVVNCAVGASAGRAEMQICDADEMSSLNENFIRSYEDSTDLKWGDSQQVEVTTIDALIEDHGAPAFCVLDIEGFEAEAIRGLNRPIPAIRAEFHQLLPDVYCSAVSRLDSLARYEFNYSTDETAGFDREDWVNANTLVRCLEAAPKNGHIYARVP